MDVENVSEAIKELGITYPAVKDNSGETCRIYQARCWPTLYLIDIKGNIRSSRIGEGADREIETTIQNLSAEDYP
ncbi:MAG: hypothetical protein WBB64_14455 [Anaerolineales bacterium]